MALPEKQAGLKERRVITDFSENTYNQPQDVRVLRIDKAD